MFWRERTVKRMGELNGSGQEDTVTVPNLNDGFNCVLFKVIH